MHNYGRFLISTHTLAAGTTAEKLFRVITAGEKPLAITQGHYFGGDSGESMQLFLVPPNSMTEGMLPSASPGVIVITAQGAMRGAQGTPEEPQCVFGVPMDNRWPMTVIPPFGSIACSLDASNAAAMTITLGGFELNA
jgi:hypothetical protein